MRACVYLFIDVKLVGCHGCSNLEEIHDIPFIALPEAEFLFCLCYTFSEGRGFATMISRLLGDPRCRRRSELGAVCLQAFKGKMLASHACICVSVCLCVCVSAYLCVSVCL